MSVDSAGAEPVADAGDELLGRRRPGGDPDGRRTLEPGLVDLRLVVDQVRRSARGSCGLDEAVRVGRVARADHEEMVDLRKHLLHRPLPVGGRVADVLLAWRPDVRETPAERGDDLAGLVHGERRLGHVGELCVRREVERLGFGDRLHEHGRVRRLAHRADDLLVALVADEDDRVPLVRVAPRLDVHLGHERADRVDDVVAEPGGVLEDRRRHAVGRVARPSRPPGPRSPRRRRSPRVPPGLGRRGCCGRSACARRPARRSARARARPSPRRARPPRSSRAARPEGRGEPPPQGTCAPTRRGTIARTAQGRCRRARSRRR